MISLLDTMNYLSPGQGHCTVCNMLLHGQCHGLSVSVSSPRCINGHQTYPMFLNVLFI